MMLERHYDEESLIELLHSGEGFAGSDPHLSSCPSCTVLLESYRVITEALGDGEVWAPSEIADAQAAARGATSLRAFASAMETEDDRAVALVDELLLLPRQWWVATVERDQRYHNAGVVRRLIEVSEAKIDTMPSEAVTAAAAAIAVGDDIGDGDAQIHGTAYRQHAFALFYTGDFPGALTSIERAQQIFERTSVSEYAIARLNIVRALVYRAQDRFTEALALARSSAQVFRSFGDSQRLASAIMTEAALLMHQHRYRDALPLLQEVERKYAADLDTRARAIHNIAICQKLLGHIAEALTSYQAAAAVFDELGSVTDAALVRYNVALLLVGEGKREEGRKRMRAARSELQHLGMVHTAVVASLDLAELAVLDRNFPEVEQLCRVAMTPFETAGIAHSSEALTALTFLREAAEQRRATQETVWHVRTYLKRLPHEPALLFAPAPLPPA